jgi:phosphomannomutase
MLRQEYGEFPLDTRDGVKVTLPEGWFLVRGSNTEPIIRVVAESRSESQAREIVTRIYGRVASCIN